MEWVRAGKASPLPLGEGPGVRAQQLTMRDIRLLLTTALTIPSPGGRGDYETSTSLYTLTPPEWFAKHS